jgi:hypothetical protein
MTNLKRSLTVTAATLTIAATLGSAVGRAQKPDPGFKGEPMRGTWGFSASGTIVPPAASAPTPVAIVGLMTFDPDTRDCVIVDVANVGGTRLRRTSDTCTYSLDTNGRGSIVALFPGETEPSLLEFVLVDREREMRFIRTDLAVAEGVAKLQ